ncbi:FtsH protease activity modulator HflK [Hyphobacterium sp. CCMP332]|uniref:FtsH protease activity modulator HflK n=1 Tax=Hyphobacterium sp. CCMP332 TaxID=2749086 RepID=UPI00164EEBCD|nr:FtsH protease activity modulator HflK [Hyphobacterium sp. CCMP332]QNL18289.1 FtsH protease activity modulator HflK [Hyphobacterium sp. CCMP332]
MPWNDNAGGGGGGPWGSGGNGDRNRNNPWGQNGGGGGGRSGQEPPDLDELVGKLQAGLSGLFGGGGSGGSGGGKSGKGGGIFGAIIIAAAVGFGVIIWPGQAVYQVQPSEVGVVMRFGEYVRTAPPGLNLKMPWPIESVEFPNVTETRTISIGNNNIAESQMLTRDENIVDIAFEVQWRVDTANIDNFVFNVRDPEAAVRAVAESAMREVAGTSDLVPIITTARAEVSQRTRQVMQETLDEYEAGIQILQVNLERAQAPQSVIDAFRDVDSAAQDAERVRLNATAHANRVIPEARGNAAQLRQEAQGYRDSVIAEAQGDADRFVAIYNEYALAPDVTRRRMYLETMERVLGGSELIILDEQGGAIPYLPLDQLGRNRTQGGQ